MGSFRNSTSDRWKVFPGILRDRIVECRYWKEKCFALSIESLIDRAAELSYFGFSYGDSSRPTPYLCLLAKLVQLDPDIDTLMCFLEFSAGRPSNDTLTQRRDLRYLRALTIAYIRLACNPATIYRVLDGLTCDYRNLLLITPSGAFSTIAVDEFIDLLLDPINKPVYGFIFPQLTKRQLLVSRHALHEYKSVLDSELVYD
jgi:pre-mRNA-splicing factor 38A